MKVNQNYYRFLLGLTVAGLLASLVQPAAVLASVGALALSGWLFHVEASAARNDLDERVTELEEDFKDVGDSDTVLLEELRKELATIKTRLGFQAGGLLGK